MYFEQRLGLCNKTFAQKQYYKKTPIFLRYTAKTLGACNNFFLYHILFCKRLYLTTPQFVYYHQKPTTPRFHHYSKTKQNKNLQQSSQRLLNTLQECLPLLLLTLHHARSSTLRVPTTIVITLKRTSNCIMMRSGRSWRSRATHCLVGWLVGRFSGRSSCSVQHYLFLII